MKQIEITAQEQPDGNIKILGIKNCLTIYELEEKYPSYLRNNNIVAWSCYDAIINSKRIGITTEGYGSGMQYTLIIGESYSKEYFNEFIRLLKIAGDNLHKAIQEKNKPFVVKI